MRKLRNAGAALGAVVALVGCVPGGQGPGETPKGAPATPTSSAVQVSAVTPALSVTTPSGQKVSVSAAPKRIVCLTGVCDDILASLGITPVATATPKLASRPEIFGAAGASIPVVPGSFGSEDTAAIAAVKPDLIIGLAGVHEAAQPALEKFAPVMLANVQTDEDSVGYLRSVATLTGRVDEQVKAETTYRQAIDDAAQRAQKAGVGDQRVLVMWGGASGMGVAPKGADPLATAMSRVVNYPFEVLGSDPVKAGAYSMEQLLEKDPQVIFVSSLTFSPSDKTASELFAANPVWKQLSAVKQGKVHEVSKELWTFCRGTRCIAKAVGDAVDQLERNK